MYEPNRLSIAFLGFSANAEGFIPVLAAAVLMLAVIVVFVRRRSGRKNASPKSSSVAYCNCSSDLARAIPATASPVQIPISSRSEYDTVHC